MNALNMPATCFFVLVVVHQLVLLQCSTVYCSEFNVGERVGWAVPSSNDTGMYNKWASSKRFNVGDTLRFKYEKDSVVEVDEEGYKECDATRPQFFSNTGDTTFKLDRSGFFYFISGTMGHCEKGQRMIVWVMSRDNNNAGGNSPPSSVSNGCYDGACDIFFFSVSVILGHVVMSVFQLV